MIKISMVGYVNHTFDFASQVYGVFFSKSLV